LKLDEIILQCDNIELEIAQAIHDMKQKRQWPTTKPLWAKRAELYKTRQMMEDEYR